MRIKRPGRKATKLTLSAVLMAALPGCLTVGMDNEFTETVEAYRGDGTLESVSRTQWTQNARGGPFTDVERLKQDTLYTYEGPEGAGYEIGQGSGAEGVRGGGQVDALMAALEALSAVVANLVPPPVAGVPKTSRSE